MKQPWFSCVLECGDESKSLALDGHLQRWLPVAGSTITLQPIGTQATRLATIPCRRRTKE